MGIRNLNKPTPANVTIWIAVITFICQNVPNVFESAELFTTHTIKVVGFTFDIINQIAAAAAIFYGVKK